MAAYSSVGILETFEPACGVLPLFAWDNCLQDVLDNAPEFIVLLFDQHDETSRLRVEARRHILNGLCGNLLDPVVGDGGLLGELVDGPAVLDGLAEGELAGHGGCGGGAAVLFRRGEWMSVPDRRR